MRARHLSKGKAAIVTQFFYGAVVGNMATKWETGFLGGAPLHRKGGEGLQEWGA